MRRLSLLGLLAVACLSTAARPQDNWPRFRGPNADGVAPDNPGLPTTWTTTENVKWVADVPGWGWSCPVVWGDRVFLTTVVSDEENVTPEQGAVPGRRCARAGQGHSSLDGLLLRSEHGQRALETRSSHRPDPRSRDIPRAPTHRKRRRPTASGCTSCSAIWACIATISTASRSGREKIEPKKTFFDYGAAASPVVHDGQVIVVYDNLEDSWIAAFDAQTGDERWRTPRDETHSWATPFVWTNQLRTEIVVPGKKRNRSYSLDGKLLWEFDGKMSNLVIPSPFAAHGLCYIASGYVGDNHRPTFAVRPGASGDIAPDGDFENSEFIAWYQGTSSSYNPSQIVYGDYLYTLYDRGFLTCHDAKTGEEVYGKQRFSPRGSFTASPFAFNGHLFFLSEDGLTYVVKPGPEFEIVADETISTNSASPVPPSLETSC